MTLKPAQVVIIGGGCIGASTAWHLAKAGCTDVAIVEKDYPVAGATGRCAGGMRQQWSTRPNILIAKYSLEAFGRFEQELGQDIDYVQGGYLLPAYTPQMIHDFKKNIQVQNSCGVNTRFVTPGEVSQIAPLLNTDEMIGAAYGPTDAKANPFLVVKGYIERAREMGVTVYKNTTAVGFETSGDRIAAVVTDTGRIACDWVLNAAGGNAADVAGLADVDVPIAPYRHQLFVTEPIQRCLDPMVVNLHDNIYFCQAKHGALLVGQTDKGEPPSYNIREHWKFQVEVSKKLARMVPKFRKLKIVRHWAGYYAVTPDRQPIIGRFSRYENFLISAGFSGHGFMVSPGAGKLVSELITEGKTHTMDIEDYSIERFKNKQITIETNVV